MFDFVLPFFFLASGVTANKLILYELSATLAVGIRMIVAGSILFTIACYQKKGDFIRRVIKMLPYLILLASFATFIPATLKAYALKHTFSSKIALIGGLDPFITTLYSYIIWRERLSWKKWIGIIFGFAGSAMIIVSQSASLGNEVLGPLSLAELAALGSVCVSRFGWIKIQQLLKSRTFNVKEINGLCMLIASFYAFASIFIFSPHDLAVTWTWKLTALNAYTIVAGNLIGYSFYSYLLRKHSATLVSLSGFSMPIFVYIFGWLFAGEKLYYSFIPSACVTLVGLIIFYKDEINVTIKE
jgi:drug/metabolite transporter (DMT)-like permease